MILYVYTPNFSKLTLQFILFLSAISDGFLIVCFLIISVFTLSDRKLVSRTAQVSKSDRFHVSIYKLLLSCMK